ncbi:MAG: hypothetical protein DMG73_03775 [Acidobacteria bacterium]|jgi:hypothetical protein|nr:MAG: hypothetical protein DMG73_03775 [Acidobacteriota bacterium]PYX66534.1 MAG: hypothetical protein DMG74_03890 [Acidobacteriota bacterium]
MPIWTPREVRQLMVCGTGCLCLVVLVLGTVIGVLDGRITPEILGKVSNGATGVGLLGLALILFWIIRLSLSGQRRS